MNIGLSSTTVAYIQSRSLKPTHVSPTEDTPPPPPPNDPHPPIFPSLPIYYAGIKYINDNNYGGGRSFISSINLNVGYSIIKEIPMAVWPEEQLGAGESRRSEGRPKRSDSKSSKPHSYIN
jgi:hypothetical protein